MKKTKKIIEIWSSYPPPYGGVSIHSMRLYNILKYKYNLVFKNFNGILDCPEDGIYKVQNQLKEILSYLLRRNKIIHLHSNRLLVWLIMFFYVKSNRLLLTLHSQNLKKNLPFIKDLVVKMFFRKVDFIIISNQTFADYLILKYKLNRDKVVVIPSFIFPLEQESKDLPKEITSFFNKYNYYINKYIISNDNNHVEFDLLIEKHKIIQQSNILRNIILPIYYLFKYLFIKEHIIIQYDSQRFTLFLLNLINRLTKRNKILVMVHHLPALNNDGLIKDKLSKYFEGLQLNCANVVVCNSLSTEESIRTVLIKKIPIYLIYPAFDFYNKHSRKETSNSLIKLLFVGTLYERKGLEYLIEAIVLIDRDNFILDLIGSKSVKPQYVKSLESLIRKYNLTSQVKLHGAVHTKVG